MYSPPEPTYPILNINFGANPYGMAPEPRDSYTYDANDPDLIELGLQPQDVEMSSSGTDETEVEYVNLSIPHMDPILESLIKIFNDLPRLKDLHNDPAEGSATLYPSVWHFGVRHVLVSPPGPPIRTLCIWLANSYFVHMCGILNYRGCPATAREDEVFIFTKAPAIARLILRAFNTHFRARRDLAYQPWELMTDDRRLAQAVGAILKKGGVVAHDLCDIKVASPEYRQMAEAAYSTYENAMRRMFGTESGNERGGDTRTRLDTIAERVKRRTARRSTRNT